MIFPFSVNFNTRLKATVIPDNQQEILQCIVKSILDNKADNVVVKDMSITYKGSTSYARASLFGSVDDGIFTLILKDGSWWLNYRINMRKLFITTTIMSGIMGVFSFTNGGPWWVGIVMFLWLCGANWVIILIRHGSVAANVAYEIDKLICGEPDLPEEGEDKMTGELKSWF